jgi:cytoskeletal protein CcmA (bactofilin family)
MGTGYTRNDVSNNIADGNIINASDLDGEFDAVESAFNSSTGHTHDGTAAEGGAITVVGPVQDLVVSATEVKPKTTNTLDLGTAALLYKDAYLQGNMYFRDTALKIVSSADGQLDIDADVELELVAPTVDIDASTALTVDTASTTFTSTLFNVTGSANITGDLDVDNININGNTIISTDTNGAINITPNGTGAVNITATMNITGDLDVDNININGNTIISTDTNGNIALTPNGTGEVDISKVDIDSGAIDGVTLGTNSAVTEAQVDNININGNTISSTDTNGNLTLAPNGTGVVALSSTDLTFGDNDKAIFGAGSDLQIYHESSDNSSRIVESGSGNLYLAGNNLYLTNPAVNEVYLDAVEDGTVRLYYNNAAKLATTATGVSITGDITGILASGTGGDTLISAISGVSNGYQISVDASNNQTYKWFNGGIQSMTLNSSGNVGIGTSSIASGGAGTTNFNVHTPSSNTVYFKLSNTGTGNTASDGFDLMADSSGNGYVFNRENANLIFGTNNTEQLRINSSGSVGIGTFSPGAKLGLQGSSGNSAISFHGTSGSAVGYMGSTAAGNYILGAAADETFIRSDGVGIVFSANTGSSAQMRIDSSGNVTIQPAGTTTRSFGETVAVKKDQSAPTRLSVRNDTNDSSSSAGVTVSAAGNSWAIECGSSVKNSNALTFALDATAATPSEKMRITTAGNVGIGTSSPAYTLQVGEANGQMSLGNAGVSNGASRLKFLSSNAQKNWQISTNDNISGALEFTQTTAAGGTTFAASPAMLINNIGNVGIGTSSPAFLLDVRGDVAANYLAYFKNDGNNSNRYGVLIAAGADSGDGTLMGFTDGDGTGVGGITFSGGTVTYGTFTAQHPCIIPDADNDPDSDLPAYPYGTLLETTSLSYTPKSDGTDSERGIRYHVRKTQTANSKAVLGAYGCSMNGGPENQTNEHQALVLGDGHILCNNSGGNIEMGDGICSSAVVGIGQKATASPSMIIGIAQEAVTFSSDTETKLVAVQYGLQQFTPW